MRPVPRAAMNEREASAIRSYMRKVPLGVTCPQLSAETALASDVFVPCCAPCHAVEGEGGASDPDLTHSWATRDAAWLRNWISDPKALNPAATMPAFGRRLTEEQVSAIANFRATGK